MQYEKSCGIICYHVNDNKIQVLLINHVFGKHWSFPKGHVEDGETEMETAIREVKEETGVTTQLLPDFREVTTYNPTPNITKDVVFFAGKSLNTDLALQVEEIKQAEFLSVNEAFKRLTFYSDRKILKKALTLISKIEEIPFP